jgi:hypothetical protein
MFKSMMKIAAVAAVAAIPAFNAAIAQNAGGGGRGGGGTGGSNDASTYNAGYLAQVPTSRNTAPFGDTFDQEQGQRRGINGDSCLTLLNPGKTLGCKSR